MTPSEEKERVEFTSEMLAGLLKAGCSHEEVCQSVGMVADVLEAVYQADIHPADFLATARDKTSFVSGAAQAVPWEALGNIAGNIGNTVLNAGTNTAGRLIDTVASNAIPAAVLAPVAAGVVGYGAGQLVGQATDDPDERISDIKHQELISALRQSTERIKKRRQG